MIQTSNNPVNRQSFGNSQKYFVHFFIFITYHILSNFIIIIISTTATGGNPEDVLGNSKVVLRHEKKIKQDSKFTESKIKYFADV